MYCHIKNTGDIDNLQSGIEKFVKWTDRWQVRCQDTSDPGHFGPKTFRHYQTGAELSPVSTSITHAKMPTLGLMLSLH